jgi:hypothetical protein
VKSNTYIFCLYTFYILLDNFTITELKMSMTTCSTPVYLKPKPFEGFIPQKFSKMVRMIENPVCRW